MKQSAWRGAAEFVMAVTRRFFEDRAAQAAGSLTFTTLLSVVPLLAVALSLSTAFPVFDEAITTLQLFLFENFLPDADGVETISEQILSFTEQAGRLTTIGLAFLVVTAVMLMLTIDDTLNRIFRVRRRRPLAHKIIVYWSVLTLWPALIGASLSLTTYLIGNASMPLRLVPFAFTWAALTLLYILVPYRHVGILHAASGGLLAGAAFEVAKRAFALYLANFPTYTMIYGAFAALPVFLLWMYVSWLVVLAGAVFTAMLPGYRVIALERNRAPGRELTEALDILAVLSRAQDGGDAAHSIGRPGHAARARETSSSAARARLGAKAERRLAARARCHPSRGHLSRFCSTPDRRPADTDLELLGAVRHRARKRHDDIPAPSA
jgi:membrane protein